jgi:hypothetical protein
MYAIGEHFDTYERSWLAIGIDSRKKFTDNEKKK